MGMEYGLIMFPYSLLRTSKSNLRSLPWALNWAYRVLPGI